jgi:hypothetical protein
MINIRYHIVSITAVFLALGIGVALGSTFLDRATVDVLDRNIRSAETRIRETKDENARLAREIEDARERDTSLIVVGSETLVEDHLTDVPVLIVAAPGVGEDDAAALRTVLERSGADLRGMLQVREEFAFAGGDVDAGLADDLGLDDPSAAELAAAARSQLVGALVAAGAPAEEGAEGDPEADPTTTTTTAPSTTVPSSTAPGDPTSTSTTAPTTTTTAPADEAAPGTPDGTQPDIVTTLLDRDYLRLSPGPGRTQDDPILETTGYRYVYLGGPDLTAAENAALLSILPRGDDGGPIPATIASATQEQPLDGSGVEPTVVAIVRGDGELAGEYSTSDEAETFAGLYAIVQTLAQVGEATPGHYGQADGATAVLPPAR